MQLMVEAERRGILPPDKRALLAEARKRGLVKSETSPGKGGLMRALRRGSQYLTLGFGDEIAAGIDTAGDIVGDVSRGEIPNVREDYSENLAEQRRRNEAAFDNSDRSMVQAGVDIAADTAGITGNALMTLPLMPQRIAATTMEAANAAKPMAAQAYDRLMVEMGKGTQQQVAARTTADVVAPMSTREVAGESMRIGGAYAGTHGAGIAEGDLADQVSTVGTNLVGGMAIGRAVPNVIQGADNLIAKPIRQAFESRRAAGAPTARIRSEDFQEAGVDEFGPVLTDDGLVQGTASGLANSVFGGPIREGARRSVNQAETAVIREMQGAGGTPTPHDAGTQVQNFLRKNLTEESIPSEQMASMAPEQLQDISSVGPSPGHTPQRPVVEPAPPAEVIPVSPDEALSGVASRVPEVRPKIPPREEVRIDTKLEDVPIRPGLKSKLKTAEDKLNSALGAEQAAHNAQKMLQQDISSFEARVGLTTQFISRNNVGESADVRFTRPDGTSFTYNYTMQRAMPEPTTRAQAIGLKGAPAITSQDRKAIDNFREIYLSRFDVDKLLRDTRTDVRHASEVLENVKGSIRGARSEDLPDFAAARHAKEQEAADQRYQRTTEDAESVARIRTQERRELVKAIAEPKAQEMASKMTKQRELQAKADAEAATARRQQAADREYQSDLARRRALAEEPIRIGESGESFPTEFAAAYEQVGRNSPKIQPELLASGSSMSRLLESLGKEARSQFQLKGWKQGDGLTPEFEAHLTRVAGPALTDILKRYAAPGFKPGLDGLRNIRTLIGRDIGRIKKHDTAAARGQLPPRDDGRDLPTLQRVYDALSDEMYASMNRAPGGDFAARQLEQVTTAYRDFTENIKAPLAKVFGNNVAPDKAIGLLRSAASVRGDINTLKAFYRVVENKGDRVQMTNLILHDMADGGLQGFLKSYRDLSPDARAIMFRGPSAAFGKSLDNLARVGGYLEKFAKFGGDDGAMTFDKAMSAATRLGNVLTALVAWLDVTTAIAGVGGSSAVSRTLASPQFRNWVKRQGAALPKPQQWKREARRLRSILTSVSGLNEDVATEIANQLGNSLGE